MQREKELFTFENSFEIYDAADNRIGSIRQEKVTASQAAARVAMLGRPVRSLQKFRYKLFDSAQRQLMSCELKTGDGTVRDGANALVGKVGIKTKLVKIDAYAKDPNGVECAWARQTEAMVYDYPITDAAGSALGRIFKEDQSFSRNFFTNADNYVIEFNDRADRRTRLLLFAMVLMIDKYQHEDG